MRLHVLGFLLLLINAVPAIALSGYAYGSDHCYHFDAPRGWTMDIASGVADGLPVVFYPNGAAWQSAPIAIYTRPSASAPGRSKAVRIAEQVSQVLDMYRSSSEDIKASRLRAVRSRTGAKGELWHYSGYSNGGAELVVYFPATKTVNFFVMQVAQATSADRHIPVLLELAESYRSATDCKPCSVLGACVRGN